MATVYMFMSNPNAVGLFADTMAIAFPPDEPGAISYNLKSANGSAQTFSLHPTGFAHVQSYLCDEWQQCMVDPTANRNVSLPHMCGYCSVDVPSDIISDGLAEVWSRAPKHHESPPVGLHERPNITFRSRRKRTHPSSQASPPRARTLQVVTSAEKLWFDVDNVYILISCTVVLGVVCAVIVCLWMRVVGLTSRKVCGRLCVSIHTGPSP